VAWWINDFQIMIDGEQRFRTSEAAFAVNREGRIVAWNKAAATTFGYHKTEAMNRCCWELLSGQDIFGNQLCCEGCPIRAAAFDDKPANRFQVNFKTGIRGRKNFSVSTVMLLNGPEKNAFVHLCRPERGASDSIRINNAKPNSRHKPLTNRETEVLALMHKGLPIPEIAKEMSVSLLTVRNHCQHIFSKLRVHSRFEAVATGRKLHLI